MLCGQASDVANVSGNVAGVLHASWCPATLVTEQKTGLHSVRKNGGIMGDGLLVQHFVSKIWPFFRQALGALKNTRALHFLVVWLSVLRR